MRVDYNSKPNRGVAQCTRAQLICIELKQLKIACGLECVNKYAEHWQPSILFFYEKKLHPKVAKYFYSNASGDQILFYFLYCIHHTHCLFPYSRSFTHLRACECTRVRLYVMCVFTSQECIYGFYYQRQCALQV